MIDLIIPIQQTAATILATCLGIAWILEKAGLETVSEVASWAFTTSLCLSSIILITATLVRIWI